MISLLLLASLVSLRLPNPDCKPRETPCITVVVSVKPERNNQEVRLELFVDGDLYRGSSLDMSPFCEQKDDGESCKYPPQSLQITYPRVPPGSYVIKATLFKHEGKTWQAGSDQKQLEIR